MYSGERAVYRMAEEEKGGLILPQPKKPLFDVLFDNRYLLFGGLLASSFGLGVYHYLRHPTLTTTEKLLHARIFTQAVGVSTIFAAVFLGSKKVLPHREKPEKRKYDEKLRRVLDDKK